MNTTDSRVGYLAKDILFTLPILTGWGRTFTLKEISTQTGMKESPEGDDITFRSVRELKNMYNLSKQDAKLLEQFVRDCNSIYY